MCQSAAARTHARIAQTRTLTGAGTYGHMKAGAGRPGCTLTHLGHAGRPASTLREPACTLRQRALTDTCPRQNDCLLRGVTHVFVDEIHERDINSDFLLILLRSILPARPNLKVRTPHTRTHARRPLRPRLAPLSSRPLSPPPLSYVTRILTRKPM